MKDILLGPILSFYSPAFYRRILQSPLGRGFTYLLYLSVIFSLILTVLFGYQLVPKADEFVKWLKTSWPEITFTKEGAVSQVKQPFTLVHPRLGAILVIDTSKDMPATEEMGKSFAYLTKTHLIVHQESRGEYRVMDLLPKNEAVKEWKDFTLTGPVIETFYRKALPYAYPFIFFFCLLVYFLWKLAAAIFYTLPALFFNLFREEKLNYGQLLNVSFFAMTAVTVLQWLNFYFGKIPMNFWIALTVTSIYLVLAILGTQEKSSQYPSGRLGGTSS